MSEWFSGIKAKFILDFIAKQRWKYITDGLKVTLEVAKEYDASVISSWSSHCGDTYNTRSAERRSEQRFWKFSDQAGRPDLSSVSDSYSWYANDGTVIDHVLYCFSIF